MTATIDSLLLDMTIMRLRWMAGLPTRDAEWVEHEHPRDEIGRFTLGAGAAADYERVSAEHSKAAQEHRDRSKAWAADSEQTKAHSAAADLHDQAAKTHAEGARGGGDRTTAERHTSTAVDASHAARQADTTRRRVHTMAKYPGRPEAAASHGELRSANVDEKHQHKVEAVLGKDLHAAARKLGEGMPGIVAKTRIDTFGGEPKFVTDFHDDAGEEVGRALRTYDSASGTVKHVLFSLDKHAQGKGIGTAYLKNSMDLYKSAGVRKVAISASLDNGAYTWAKLGFVPEQKSWDSLRKGLSFDYLTHGTFSQEETHELARFLDDPNPKAIWGLSDHPKGRAMLSGETWQGSFDVSDAESHARMSKAVEKSAARARQVAM